jgi:sugar/nucleoside kinase (ribokinase family)
VTDRAIRRLVLVGSVIVDIVLYVEALPERGGDVVASRSMTTAGGGFNVLSAAARQGLTSAYGGLVGTGPFGAQVRDALAAESVQLLLPEPAVGLDTGFCVALVEESGERTFATTVGAEAGLTDDLLASLGVRAGDAVYVSGYDLVYPHGPAIASWLSQLPDDVVVVLDPGPLVADIPAELLDMVLARMTWLSLSAREAALLTGETDTESVALSVFARSPALSGLVVRDGPRGCDVYSRGGSPAHVEAPTVVAVDTNGAGDAHVGAFLAALARGEDRVRAARSANEAAAVAVTRLGPATAPHLGDQGVEST